MRRDLYTKSLIVDALDRGLLCMGFLLLNFSQNLYILLYTSSLPEVFCKKCVLKYLAKFTGKHLCQSLFLIKLLPSATLLKRETLAQVFFCEICKIFKNTFFYRTPPMAASASSMLLPCFCLHSRKITRLLPRLMHVRLRQDPLV